MKARITLLTTNLARGGAETQVAQIARGLGLGGWKVSVTSLLAPTAFEHELNAVGVTVQSLDLIPGTFNPLKLARLLAILREQRPQILHAHMFHANVLARLARLLCPVPVVISTLHSASESGRNSHNVHGRDRWYRLTDPLSDVTVAVAGAVAERHVSAGVVPRRKLRVIPNGVDTAVFRPSPGKRQEIRRSLGLDQEFAWLAVGRLMWKKGYETLFRAFLSCAGGVLLVAGAGPEEKQLRRLALELGVNVRFLGHRNDIPQILQACDGFVQSSVVEGMPVSLLEAASSGLVCVAADAGGVGETGVARLVPIGNPEALASAMVEIMVLGPEDRNRLGLAAREHVVTHFDTALVVPLWERLYEELLAPWM